MAKQATAKKRTRSLTVFVFLAALILGLAVASGHLSLSAPAKSKKLDALSEGDRRELGELLKEVDR